MNDRPRVLRPAAGYSLLNVHVFVGVALVPLVTFVVPKLPASRVRITSVTGHAATFPLDRGDALLLATHVGGDRLAPEHGYPARLVAPGRRGFEWVTCVQRIEVF